MNVAESSVASLTITAASVATVDSLRRKLTQGEPSRRLQSAINVAAVLVTASTPASFSTTTFSSSLQTSTGITATVSNLAVVDQTPTATPTAVPTMAPVDDSSSNSMSNIPIIIGAVFGVVLLVALVAGGFVYQRKAKPAVSDKNSQSAVNPDSLPSLLTLCNPGNLFEGCQAPENPSEIQEG
jgi:hypothetical protein